MKVYRLSLAPKGLFPFGKMMKSLLSLPCSLKAIVKAWGLSKPQKSLAIRDSVTTKSCTSLWTKGLRD